MREPPPAFPRRPVLVMSRCLGFAACRYDGTRVAADHLREFIAACECIPVCPELELGLGCPRAPIRMVRAAAGEDERLLQPATGLDLTGRMRAFARRFAAALPAVHGVVLKARSPSCGPDDAKLFAGAEEAEPMGRTVGLFARVLLARLPGVPAASEERLLAAPAREEFMAALIRRARCEDRT